MGFTSSSLNAGFSKKQSGQSHWYVNPLSAYPKTPPVHLHASRTVSHTTTTDILGMLAEVARPKGNTLLHLFGRWLFQAAIWPGEYLTCKGHTPLESQIWCGCG